MTSYHANTPLVLVLTPENVKISHFLLNIYANVCFFDFVVINLICKRLLKLLID
jgi:hypothetical protein